MVTWCNPCDCAMSLGFLELARQAQGKPISCLARSIPAAAHASMRTSVRKVPLNRALKDNFTTIELFGRLAQKELNILRRMWDSCVFASADLRFADDTEHASMVQSFRVVGRACSRENGQPLAQG